MSNFEIMHGIVRLREDIAHYINTELYNITKENGNATKASDLRAFAMAAYHIGLITMDEVHHCSAAIRLARWQVVSVRLEVPNDVSVNFVSREMMNAFFENRVLNKCEEALLNAQMYVEYCISGPTPHINVDKGETRSLLKCAMNNIQNAKAYLLVGLNTSLVTDADIARYTSKANQLTNIIAEVRV